MSGAFDRCIPFVLQWEGGYVCHPDDPGGATCHGVTAETLAAWRKCAVTHADVEALQVAEACAIYRAKYWQAIRGDDLPPAVALVTLDAAVNSGPLRAAKWLQTAAGFRDPDGQIGPRTIEAVRRLDPQLVAHEMCRLRLAFLRSLRTWPVFGKGWSRRIVALRQEVDRI